MILPKLILDITYSEKNPGNFISYNDNNFLYTNKTE